MMSQLTENQLADTRRRFLKEEIASYTEAIGLLLPLRHNSRIRSELRGFLYAAKTYRQELQG